MKARINVRYTALLTSIQGHENANKQGLSIPTGLVCSRGAVWKEGKHGKGAQALQGCLTPLKG